MKVLGIAMLALATMMAVTNDTGAKERGSKNETSLKAVLTAPVAGGAKVGKAEYETKISRGVTSQSLEVEVKGLGLAVGSQVKFLVNGANVGTGIVRAGHTEGGNDRDHDHGTSSTTSGTSTTTGNSASLKLRSPRNFIPAIVKGSTVTVCTVDGITIANGTF